ncbi:MAG: hypothetical protein KGZ58_03830 [Ignavibacteriales bacterium]|nr:hypothetical protein [Ignavibacteriales bacterium]
MKQFNLISNINAEAFKAAKFIATIFKSWVMKLKIFFDFSQLSSLEYLAEAKGSVVASFPRTWQAIPSGEVRGYRTNNLSYRVPKASLWEKRVSTNRYIKWIPSFDGVTKRTGMTIWVVFLALFVCLTSAAMGQEYTTDANTVLLLHNYL